MEYGDEYALYTDCDVMFLKDILLTEKPKYLSAVTEFSNDFNSGVMLMNIKNMHQDLPALERLFNCIDITTLVNYDQGLYNLFYKNKWDHLCKYYNWRPYLGWDEQAKIIHFHGPKVENIKKLINGEEGVAPILKFLYNKNPDAYKKYYNLAVSFE